MKNADKIKALVSVVVILILAIVIVNMNSIFPVNNNIAMGQQITKQTTRTDTNVIVDSSTCVGKYGIPENAVVFIYADWCPHCANMKPVVQKLEGEGYNFYWVESSDSKASEVVINCLSDLVGGYIPQFICPKTGKEQTGEMTEYQLKQFADACI